MKQVTGKGFLVALTLIILWCSNLLWLMNIRVDLHSPLTYLFMLIQAHLYTGLFITAHDAMHGTISPDKRLNDVVGWICGLLYALFPYQKLYKNHHLHHRHVNTDEDPDYRNGNFISWYISFMRTYISMWQVIGIAFIYTILSQFIAERNLMLFLVAPSLLSTVQLFYFGTYLPHKGAHANLHRSGTLKKNHFFAFITCYFFGYHYEHHDAPHIPWWKLYKTK